MKNFLILLNIIYLTISISAFSQEIDYEVQDQSGEIPNDHYRNTTRISLSFNGGVSMFNTSTSLTESMDPNTHLSARLMFKFKNDPKYMNASIGVHFAEDAFGIKSGRLTPFANGDSLVISPIPYFSKIKLRSVGIPVLFSFSPRDKKFLNRFTLDIGAIAAFNFDTGVQKIKYTQDDVNTRLKEKFSFNQPIGKLSVLAAITFDNISVFYEYGFESITKSHHFYEGRSAFGISFKF